MILLTDGLANRGVIDSQTLVRLVERCSEREIIATAIGVGTEYNEVLLNRIADAGGDRYTYVAQPDEIRRHSSESCALSWRLWPKTQS